MNYVQGTSPPEALTIDRVAGCLLGGAVGDALGAPINKISLSEIRSLHGPAGVQEYVYWPLSGKKGGISDVTQMTLFTAEALIGAIGRAGDKPGGFPMVFFHSYRRWLLTQSDSLLSPDYLGENDGWLFQTQELHNKREPSETVRQALLKPASYGDMGSVTHPINSSRRYGGVMRISPVGFWPHNEQVEFDTFWLASEVSAITNGSPVSYLSGGFLAYLLSRLLLGWDLSTSVSMARQRLGKAHVQSADVTKALDEAVHLAAATKHADLKTIEYLGSGLYAHEAVAIAIYCSLLARDFESGVRLAVDHTGRSKVTGALAGSILGMLYGRAAIPERWVETLELRTVIGQLAADVYCAIRPWHVQYRYPTY